MGANALIGIAATSGLIRLNIARFGAARNLMVSYAHRLTIPRVLIMVAFHAEGKSQSGTSIHNLVASIEDSKSRDAVARLLNKASNVTFAVVVEKSIAAMLLPGWTDNFHTIKNLFTSTGFPSLTAAYKTFRHRSNELIPSGVFCPDL